MFCVPSKMAGRTCIECLLVLQQQEGEGGGSQTLACMDNAVFLLREFFLVVGVKELCDQCPARCRDNDNDTLNEDVSNMC